MSDRNSARSISSGHYYQGGYDYEFVNDLDSRFECPICLLCLREPYLTSCGHRFCHSCILTWLSDGKTCPHDNSSLGEGDIFRDDVVEREILQLMVKCPFESKGCPVVIRLSDVEHHLNGCQWRPKNRRPQVRNPEFENSNESFSRNQNGSDRRRSESHTCAECGEVVDEAEIGKIDKFRGQQHNLICPNTLVACPFASTGCSDKIKRKDLQAHIQGQTGYHVQLLNEKLLKLQQTQSHMVLSTEELPSPSSHHQHHQHNAGALHRTRSESASSGVHSVGCMQRDDQLRLSGSNVHATQKLLKELFQRIVTLEQKHCQASIAIDKMTQQMTQLMSQQESHINAMVGRFCNGLYVWKLTGFSDHYARMRANREYVRYSDGFYTQPTLGYKLCLRANVHIIDGDEHLGIFVHFMRGEDDGLISWPFVGKITVTVKNPADAMNDFTEVMSSTCGMTAFERPVEARNIVGYGLQKFIRVNCLYTGAGGFISNDDTLVITAKVLSSN